MVNKRGWIRIVEAFIAVLLIAGILLFVLNKGYIGEKDISEQVYQIQLSILNEIELNNDLRIAILEVNLENNPFVPTLVVEKINERIPDYLTCTSRICELDQICSSDIDVETDIYAKSVAIVAQGGTYSPRQLKMFCWTA